MFAVLFALTSPAWASGIDVPILGSGLSGPTASDAAAVYWNPAMLAELDRGQVLTGAGVVGGVIGYTRNRLGDYQIADTLNFGDPVPPEFIDPSRSGEAETVRAVPVAPTGDLFFASPRIADRLVLGGGIYVPYAAPLGFPDDGPQRFQLQRAFIAVTHVTASAGIELNDTASVGAGVTLVSGLGSISRVQDFAGVDAFGSALANPPINQPNPFGIDAPSTVRELDVLARPFTFTDGASLGVDFNIGLVLRPADGVILGASYQHGSRLRFHGDFALDMDHPFFTTDLAAQGLSYDPLVTGDATLSFRLPNRTTAGTTVALSDTAWWDGRLEWIRWSALSSFDLRLTSKGLAQPEIGLPDTIDTRLPRDWVDAFHIENRIRAEWSERFTSAATLGFHTGASPDSTIDVASPDGNRLLGAVTGKLRVSDRAALISDLEVSGILPRTVRSSDSDLGNGRYTMVIASAFAHLQVDLGKAP